jgi:hypothetical protein
MVSCSKEETPEDKPVTQNITYSLVSNETLPGEVVEIKINKQITNSEIELILNNKPIKAYANGDYSYVFITPVLASGDYTLKFTDNDLSLKLKINSYTAIKNPEEVINEFVVNRDKCFEAIKEVGASLETLLLIDQIKEEWDLQYSQNSAEDKMLLAYMMKKNTVNPEWFTAPSEYPDSYYSKSNVFALDAGEKLVTTAKVFVTAQTVCLASIPAMVGTGTLFLSAPNFVTGALFIATFTVFIVSREVAIQKAEEVGRLKGVAEAVSDISNKGNAVLQFVKDSDTDISMKINFRNLNATDLNIQTDIAKAFNEEKKFADEDSKVKILYDKAIKFTKKLKGLYTNHTSLIGKTTASNMTLTVLDKDIIVQGSSDANVKITSSLIGDVRKIKATSTSMEDINFNLKIAYKRAVDGKEIVKEIPCIYKAGVTLIGTWKLESFENGILVGEYINQYSDSCPNLAHGKYTYLSEVMVFKENNTITDNATMTIVNFGLQLAVGTCNVINDGKDSENTYNDASEGKYVLKGNVLEVTLDDIYGGDFTSLPIVFISKDKIKFGDSVFVRQ